MSSEAAKERFPYPIEDPDTVRQQKTTLHNLGRLLLDRHADVNDDVLQASESWRSGSASIALSDTSQLATSMQGDSNALAGALPPMTTYIGRIEDARALIDRIRVRYDQAVEDQVRANLDVPDWADNAFRAVSTAPASKRPIEPRSISSTWNTRVWHPTSQTTLNLR
ncbi:MAG: hypothetical protein L0H93_14365 [Nocardioides sp.]|nr:hypothetical protein [Nocardioides sp.]